MPTLPRNKRHPRSPTRRCNLNLEPRAIWKALEDADLEDLAEKMKDRFKWTHSPRAFQLDAIKAQLKRQDVVVHAGTGSGKTAIAAGPFALQKTRGRLILMVSPLIALQDEQVSNFMQNTDSDMI